PAVREPSNDRKGSLERREALDDRLRSRKLGRVRQPAEGGDDLHQRLQRLPRFLQPQLRQPPPRQDLAAAEAVGEELLATRFVLERKTWAAIVPGELG